MRRPQLVDGGVWQASKDIALAVADGSSVAEVGQAVMDAIDRMVGIDLGSIITAIPGWEWSTVGHVGGWPDNRFLLENYSRFSEEMSPVEHRGMARGFLPVEAIFEPRRQQSLAIFREFLLPRGLKRVLSVAWVADDQIWTLGVTRTNRIFSDRELARLNALLSHIRAALRALAWRPGGLHGGELAGAHANRGVQNPWGLTTVQARTLNLVIRGLTNKEAAGLLGASPNTVRNTLVEIFRKVGVSRRSELSFAAITAGDAARLRRSEPSLRDPLAFMDSIVSEISSQQDAAHTRRVRRAKTAR
jgi:DNA-binding CsgD family transcriptional regulator